MTTCRRFTATSSCRKLSSSVCRSELGRFPEYCVPRRISADPTKNRHKLLGRILRDTPYMIVLGIDPGSIRTGWGVVRRDGPRLSFVAAGTIDASKEGELPERLNEIYECLRSVIAEHAPTAVAVEDIFHARFAASALKLGHARGVALLVGAQAGLPVPAYAP